MDSAFARVETSPQPSGRMSGLAANEKKNEMISSASGAPKNFAVKENGASYTLEMGFTTRRTIFAPLHIEWMRGEST